MSKELLVSCPLCNDMFHTINKIGEMEGCTLCDDVFIIEESDVIDSTIDTIYNLINTLEDKTVCNANDIRMVIDQLYSISDMIKQ